MTSGDYIALAGLLTVHAGAIIGFLLRLERRITRLEVIEEGRGRRALDLNGAEA